MIHKIVIFFDRKNLEESDSSGKSDSFSVKPQELQQGKQVRGKGKQNWVRLDPALCF